MNTAEQKAKAARADEFREAAAHRLLNRHEGTGYVPRHYTGRLRAKLVTPIWPLLPSSAQRWLCGCPICCGQT